MSSFRVERDRVAVFPGGIPVGNAIPVAQPESRQKEDDRWQQDAWAQIRRLQEQARRELESAVAQADKQLAEAKAQAEAIEREAREGVRKSFSDGRQHGYAEGQKQAYEENALRKKQEATMLEKMMTDIRQERADIIDALRGEVIGLVMEITKRVLGIKLKENDEAFLNVINAELARLKQSETVTITLSTEDYIRYFFGDNDYRDSFGDKDVRVKENRSFQPGDCVIETEGEIIDCGIPGQLDRIEKSLKDVEDDRGSAS